MTSKLTLKVKVIGQISRSRGKKNPIIFGVISVVQVTCLWYRVMGMGQRSLGQGQRSRGLKPAVETGHDIGRWAHANVKLHFSYNSLLCRLTDCSSFQMSTIHH